ncbi:DUF3995 domain-containing protein [Lentzea albidocapillata]|uniref:DUF3995 domain-containing protein n=1 Tax=Lentzea albidocapillata TaxID=40571 RepID=A0A1W2FCF1_9PSEU|nr:DUF3995 domain-containing protein [Lentzea albidocapillata]SMD19308.1 Protein of unknown function [Lentzea albidocapillata]
MSGSPAEPAIRAGAPWFSYATAAWAFAFALIHVYWAFGGGLGLPDGFSVPDNTALLIIDIIAVPLCVGGGLLGLALVRPWGARFPRRLLLAAAWSMSALCLIHSVPTVISAGIVLARGTRHTLSLPEQFSYFGYEPYWFLGGLLAGLAALVYQRATR